MVLAKEIEYYTYADFLEWDENFRAELVDGDMVMMAPPSRIHQGLITQLVFQLESFLKGKPCKLYPAPFAVRLFPQKDNSDDTVFEPDIVVVCDSSKLDDRGCNGAPDFIIEIISPSTAKYDRIVKFRKYQNAGVREYWIADPETRSVQVGILENGRYVMYVYDDTEKVPVTVLPGCEIDLAAVFADQD
jgi:Uma2 family endonuclease